MGPSLRAICAAAAAVCVLLVSGCGINSARLDEAEATIQALTEKGVPDSLLTDARVQLLQARTGLRTGNTALAGQNADAMYKLIAAAETWYEETQARFGPEVRSRRDAVSVAAETLSGPQKAFADSLLAVIDKMIADTWVTQASKALDDFEVAMVQLILDEERMVEVRRKVPGVWGEQAKTVERDLNAIRTKRFVFETDGAIMLDERMIGRSGPELKEDWQYLSWGNWEVKGDTVFISINREKRVKQMFDNLVGGKWLRRSDAPYDSTISDGSKDLFVTYSYMLENMKKLTK